MRQRILMPIISHDCYRLVALRFYLMGKQRDEKTDCVNRFMFN